jgi:hypothetical protein
LKLLVEGGEVGQATEEPIGDEEKSADFVVPEEGSAEFVDVEQEGFLGVSLEHIISEVSSFLVLILSFLFLLSEDCLLFFSLLVDLKLVFRRIPRSFLFKLSSYQERVSAILVFLFLTFGVAVDSVKDLELLTLFLG